MARDRDRRRGRDARRKDQAARAARPQDHRSVEVSRSTCRTASSSSRKAVYSTVMGYRTDVFPDGKRPKSWADFWDVQEVPRPAHNARTVRSTISSSRCSPTAWRSTRSIRIDVDRAFKKLDQIKPHITVWWTTGAQSAQLLVDKEAVLAAAWNGRYYVADQEGRADRDRVEPGRDQGIAPSSFRRARKMPTGDRRCSR